MVRQIYSHTNAAVAVEYVERLGHDLQDESCPPEINQLGRTLRTWRHQIAAWHQAHVSNGPTEAVNNLIKRVKRAAFGMMSGSVALLDWIEKQTRSRIALSHVIAVRSTSNAAAIRCWGAVSVPSS